MKKKILIAIFTFISCVLLSVVIEIFGFNYKNITLSENDQSIPSVSYTSESVNDLTTVQIKLDNKYVDKLVIDYHSTENIEYTIVYTYSGPYGNQIESEKSVDMFDDSFTSSVTNIEKTVSNITIEYKSTDNLTINNISTDNHFHFNYYRMIFILIVFFTIICLIYFYKNGFRTEKLHIYFAILCSLLGSMIITAQPAATFYSWDDQIHFEKTIDWFGGTIKYSNGEYNLSDATVLDSAGRSAVFSADEKQKLAEYLDSNIDHDYTKTLSRIPSLDKISYFPMAIGYNLAKIIHLPFTACFYIGKIFNLIFYTLPIAYAIKIIKVGKRLLAIIALLPTNVFLASNYSCDPAVFTGLTILIAHIVNLFLDKTTKLDFKTAVIIIAAAVYACFAKAIYAPFLLLTLLIPKERFSSSKQSKLVKIGFFVITIFLLSISFLPNLSGSSQSDSRGGDTSTGEQLSLILNHPFDYATVLGDTAVNRFSYKFLGNKTIEDYSYMNPTGTSIENSTNAANGYESNIYYIILLLLFFVFLTDNKNNVINKKQRWSGIGITLFVILLIWSALYLSFTPVGLNTINGVQGRYFLPLLFPILLFIQPRRIQNKINPKIYNTLIFATISTIVAILTYLIILVPYSF